MNAVFTPLGLVLGLLAGQVSKKIFDWVWGLVDEEEAPRPKHREVPMVKLLAALLVEGAIARVVRGLVDHGTRRGWATLTGDWPGEERPEPE
jgi:Protein of unknown function (DUF4235)